MIIFVYVVLLEWISFFSVWLQQTAMYPNSSFSQNIKINWIQQQNGFSGENLCLKNISVSFVSQQANWKH